MKYLARTGIVLAPSVVIGAAATIAAGAVVLRSVPPGVTMIGNPARIAKGDTAHADVLQSQDDQ